jgi:hypothetical protein
MAAGGAQGGNNPALPQGKTIAITNNNVKAQGQKQPQKQQQNGGCC